MSFQSGTTATLTAGDPMSWFIPGLDWGDNMTTSYPEAGGHAAPNLTQAIQITTSRDATALLLHFIISDKTIVQHGSHMVGPNHHLQNGDQIVVSIDPDNSGHLGGEGAQQLQVIDGERNTGDHRFEITLPNAGVTAVTKYYTPGTIDGLTSWAGGTSVATLFPGEAFYSPVGSAPAYDGAAQRYTFTLRLPFTVIGDIAGDFGIAIGIVNDLGHASTATGNWDYTGTSFPSYMVMSAANDPLVNRTQRSGDWSDPSRWATGYTSVNPAGSDVVFSHLPEYWWSNSIRMAVCTTSHFDTVRAVTAAWENQGAIRNWYQYQYQPGASNRPCRMRIFIKAHKSGPAGGAVQRRFLVVWMTPGIGSYQKYQIAVTPTIAITGSEQFLDPIDFELPPIAFAPNTHPCIRVYSVPVTFTSTSLHPGALGLIPAADWTSFHTAANGFEEATINLNPRSAQMNFTNIGTASSCSNPFCYVHSREDVAIAGLAGGVNFSAIMPWLASAFGQSSDSGKSPPQGGDREGKEGKEEKAATSGDYIKVMVTGFAVDAPDTSRNYAYLRAVGGMGWNVPEQMVASGEVLNLKFEVPSYEQVSGSPQSGTQPDNGKVFLAAQVALRDKAGTAQVKVTRESPANKEKLEEATLVLGFTPDSSSRPDSVTQKPQPHEAKNYWWILLLLLLLLLVVVIYRRLKASKK